MNSKVVCFAGPSGVGKTSYAKRLIEKHNFTFPSVVTTRKQRSDDNECYQYVDESTFIEMVNSGRFIEWDKYSDYYYGTLLRSVEKVMKLSYYSGIILDLTPNGCRGVKRAVPDSIIIALLPDDPEWLYERLKSRNSQSMKEIQARTDLLKSYLDEIALLACKKVYASFSPDSWDKTFKEIEDIIFNLTIMYG